MKTNLSSCCNAEVSEGKETLFCDKCNRGCAIASPEEKCICGDGIPHIHSDGRIVASPEETMADLMTRDMQDIARQNFEEDKKMFKVNDNRIASPEVIEWEGTFEELWQYGTKAHIKDFIRELINKNNK